MGISYSDPDIDSDADTVSWAAITRASGFDTFAATPTSANLAALITNETGSGLLVFATSPTLTTPLLGTPTSGVLTNCIGLPAGGLSATAQYRVFGRSSSGAGAGEEIVLSANIFTFLGKASLVTGFDYLDSPGADVPSVAGVTDIGAATGHYIHVTGTEIITGFGTVAAGTERVIKFTGACTLTHNGTALILPGAANILTAANDTAAFRSLGSGNWVCLWYKRQSEVPYLEGTWTPVLTFATPGDLSVAYTTQVGTWTRNGNQVTVNASIVLSSFTHTTASGNLNITGCPFTAKTVSGQQNHGAVRFEGVTKVGYTNFTAQSSSASATILIVGSGSAVAASIVNTADMPTGGTVRFYFTLTFQV